MGSSVVSLSVVLDQTQTQAQTQSQTLLLENAKRKTSQTARPVRQEVIQQRSCGGVGGGPLKMIYALFRNAERAAAMVAV